ARRSPPGSAPRGRGAGVGGAPGRPQPADPPPGHQHGHVRGERPGGVVDQGAAAVEDVGHGRYHHPCRLVQRSRIPDMTAITARTTASWPQWVELLTITFIP